MKRMALFAVTLALVCCFSSCSEKEGVYKPKKKISAIYTSYSDSYSYFDGETWVTESSNMPKTIAEKWNWDGKLLKSIVEYESEYTDNDQVISVPYDTINFEYDGKLLTKIVNDEYHYDFVYDDGKVKEINAFSGTTSLGKITITHDGKKITQMDIIDYSADNKDAKSKKRYDNARTVLFRTLIPNMEIAKGMQQFEKKASKGAEEQIRMSYIFEWNGDNVSKFIIKQASTEVANIAFEYDNKNNPYHNFLGQLFISEYGYTSDGLSENNVTKVTYTYSYYWKSGKDAETYTEEFTYTYDGKWPTVKTTTDTDSDEHHSSTRSNSMYFEY